MKIGTAVVTYFSVDTLVNFTKELINLSAEAEYSAHKVYTLLSGGKDRDLYFEDMITASTEMGVSMSEFAEATYQAISASVAQEEAVSFVTDAVKLAKGGFTDTVTAVDLMTSVLNAYNDETLTAAHVSDVLLKTQNLGKTTVGDMASQMGRVIPIAAAYGVSLENIGTAYAMMTKGGIRTRNATTYLGTLLGELADYSDKYDDEGHVLAYNDWKSLYDTAKKNKDEEALARLERYTTRKNFSTYLEEGMTLGEILGMIREHVGGDDELLMKYFSSKEAGIAAKAILVDDVEGYNNALDQMINSEGTTEEAYATMTDTFNEKTKKLQTTFENAGIAIGEKFLPSLGDMVERVNKDATPMLNGLVSLADVIAGNSKLDIGGFLGGLFQKTSDTFTIDSRLFDYTSAHWALEQYGKYGNIGLWGEEGLEGLLNEIGVTIDPDVDEETIKTDIEAYLAENPVAVSVDVFPRWMKGFSGDAGEETEGVEGFANGIEFVSRDQMPALLHYGEAVLNRTEAREWREGRTKGGNTETINNNLNVGTINMNREMDAEAFFEQYNDFTTRRNRGYGWG